MLLWQLFPQLIKAAGDSPLELLQLVDEYGYDIYHSGPWTVERIGWYMDESKAQLFGAPGAVQASPEEVLSLAHWEHHVYINLYFEQRHLQRCLDRVALARGFTY